MTTPGPLPLTPGSLPLGEAGVQKLGHFKKYDEVLVKVSQVVYISVTTYQKSFIFGPKVPWRFGLHTMNPGSLPMAVAGGQNLGHI